jgi:hypothetical protein
MDKPKVVPLSLRADPGLVYFKIGSKRYPIQLVYPFERSARARAKVLPFRKPERLATRNSRGTRLKAEEP